MIQVFTFLFKYKILTDPVNLSYHTKAFFELSKKNQRKVLDKYFHKLENDFPIEVYFDTRESRFYHNNQEISFFHCYYFDKLIIEYNILNIRFIDKFKISQEKIEYLINYALEIIKEHHLKLSIDDIVRYPDDIPVYLSSNLNFMTYLVEEDFFNIKYLTYHDSCISRQRELIRYAVALAAKKPFCLEGFQKKNHELPKVLITNVDFLVYIIQNDVRNIAYISDTFLETLTISNRQLLIQTIVSSLKKNSQRIKIIEEHSTLANILNKDENFIRYMLEVDVENVRYVDWHNLNDHLQTKMIHYLADLLKEQNYCFDIMKYSFRDLFFQNYQFMSYLIDLDFRWLAITKVNSFEENDRLIVQFFSKVSKANYKFKLEDFLEDGKYLNHYLVENKKMLGYFFEHKVPVVQYINFFNLNHSKRVVENILVQIEKKDYEYHNEDFLIHGKYPILLGNHYRFMRYVIDKNFNYLAYLDTSAIDKRELKRIINYAFRMVYYIRGDNKSLNFDLDGYFKDSDILSDEYFQECLRSL